MQAEPLRPSRVLRLGEASQALDVPGITTLLQWRSQPELTGAPKASAPGDSDAEKRQTPAIMLWVPALPSGLDQQDLLAARQDLFLIWEALLTELLTASSLPMGLATPLTAAALPASITHLGDDPGHPTSCMVWGDSCA